MRNVTPEAQHTHTQAQFINVLKKLPLKSPGTTVGYVTTEGGTVPEDREVMPLVRRRQILKCRRGVKPT